MNNRTETGRRGRVCAIALGAVVGAGLMGCQGAGARWSTGHTDLRHERANQTAMERVRVDFVSPDEMRWSPVVTEHQLLATSHFWRDTPIPNNPSGADSQLRRQAASIGANYVRWTAVREDSESFGSRYRYRALFYRGHEDPLPMAAAVPSFQPDIRLVQEAKPDRAVADGGRSGGEPVDGIGPGEAMANVNTGAEMNEN